MAEEYLSLETAARLFGTSLRSFRLGAEELGIPVLTIFNRPTYRRSDLDKCLTKLWAAEAKPVVSSTEWSNSIRITNRLIAKLLKESK